MATAAGFEAVDLRGRYPRIVLINLEHLGGGLHRLSAPGAEPAEFRAPAGGGAEAAAVLDVRLLDVRIEAVDCGDAAATWVSGFLEGELEEGQR